MKKRNFGMDFVRSIAILCIVIFHFYINEKQLYNTEIIFPNYDLGSFGVSLFLILSGAALVISEKKEFSLKEYYIRRIRGIYPLFLCGTIFFWGINFWMNYQVFENVSKWNWILTVLGLGGIMSYKYPSYNTVGEWFIGCILILYIIYPVFRIMIKKMPRIFLLICLIFYCIINLYYPFEMPPIWCPAIRYLEFVFGIYYAKYIILNENDIKQSLKFGMLIISFVGCVICLYIPNHMFIMGKICLGGCCAFSFIMSISKYFKIPIVSILIDKIAKYSYAMFIVHHQIEYLFANHFATISLSTKNYYYTFFLYFLVVLVVAKGLVLFTNYINDVCNKIMHIKI